jgi:cation:H+ antiporter
MQPASAYRHPTLMGVALILAQGFNKWSAGTPLILFLKQFPITSTHGRLILCAVYAVAAIALVVHYTHVMPTLAAPFTGSAKVHAAQPPGDHR